MSRVERLNLALRVLMEVGIVAALAYWGATAVSGTVGRVLLGICAPLVGFGFWGAVDFRGAGRLAEPLRLLQELVVSGLAVLAAYAAGLRAFALALATLSVAYHALVYLSGRKLLDPRGARNARGHAAH